MGNGGLPGLCSRGREQSIYVCPRSGSALTGFDTRPQSLMPVATRNAPDGTRTRDRPFVRKVLYPSELPARKRHVPYQSLSRSHIPQQGGTGQIKSPAARGRSLQARLWPCAKPVLNLLANKADVFLHLAKPLSRRALPISLGLARLVRASLFLVP